MADRLRAILLALCLCGATGVWVGTPLQAQSSPSTRVPLEEELYLRSVARVFETSPEEADLLSSWLRHPSELPVLLYLSRRAGVTPDIVGSLRKGGASWLRLASRLGLSAAVFHVELGDAEVGGILERPVALFRERPMAEWYAVALTDMEIVALVNVRVLAAASGASAPDVAVALSAPAPDFMATYAAFIRERLSTIGTGIRPPH